MKLSLIWAMSRNQTIGKDNRLPWHLPEDLRYFKKVTMGKPIIMGRKTWESLGRPLPGRENIVISRDKQFSAAGIHRVHSLSDALDLARQLAGSTGANEAVVIGGAEIYALALPFAQRLYLTLVHAEIEGDTFFPDFDTGQWHEVSREDYSASDSNPYDYSFIVLEKRSPQSDY